MSSKGKKTEKSYLTEFSESSFARKLPQSKAPKSLLIVTEGLVTEPVYFRALAAHWNLHPHVATIEPGAEGIPKNLVETGLRIIQERADQDKSGNLPFNRLPTFDEKWIVFDTEHAARQNKLASGIQHAEANGFQVAHTTPCFEFWLCLHYELKAPAMDTCKEASKLLEKVAEMQKGSYAKKRSLTEPLANQLVCMVATAVRNAKTLSGQQTGDEFPANPSTAVHKLVESMHLAIPEPLKRRYPLR